jgi:hypothetical protein
MMLGNVLVDFSMSRWKCRMNDFVTFGRFFIPKCPLLRAPDIKLGLFDGYLCHLALIRSGE